MKIANILESPQEEAWLLGRYQDRVKHADKAWRGLMIELTKFAPGPFKIAPGAEGDWEARDQMYYIRVSQHYTSHGTSWAKIKAKLKDSDAQNLFHWAVKQNSVDSRFKSSDLIEFTYRLN